MILSFLYDRVEVTQIFQIIKKKFGGMGNSSYLLGVNSIDKI